MPQESWINQLHHHQPDMSLVLQNIAQSFINHLHIWWEENRSAKLWSIPPSWTKLSCMAHSRA